MKQSIAVAAAFMLGALPGFAQSNPQTLDFSPAKGKLYKPDSGPAPRVGVLVMHPTADLLNHLSTHELARRGYLVLAMNSRFVNNEAAVVWEDLALDARTGVEFLKRQPGIVKIVLFAHSGGGPTLAFYQAVAEKGPAYTQGPNKLVQGDIAKLTGLPRADGIVFADAIPGVPVAGVLRRLNPALMTEGDASRINPDLDALNPKNGFNPKGPSHYPADFRRRYFEAQADRMNRLIAAAQDKVKDGKGDEPFVIVGTSPGYNLAAWDPDVSDSTLKPQRLLKNDGSIVTQIVKRVRPLAAAAPQAAPQGETRRFKVRSFLSWAAIRSTGSQAGIDWSSSNSSTPCALRQISVPVLLGAFGAHTLIPDNEMMYEMAASADKEFIIVEGATHGFTPCREGESTPGQYSNTVKNFFDYVQKWIDARF